MALDEKPDEFDEGFLLDQVDAAIRRRDLGQAAALIYSDIYGENVTLTSTRWRDLWPEIRPRFATFAHINSAQLKKLDDQFGSIQPTDPEIYNIRLLDQSRVVFILGAGASVPSPSNLPTVSDLLPELWRRAGKLGREDLRSLETWCRDQGISNIEDLLTAAYIANSASKNSSVLSLLEYFLYSREEVRPGGRRRVQSDASALSLLQDTLQNLLGLLLGRMIEAEPNATHEAIVKLARQTGKVSVITTNYDGCIDQAFSNAGVECNYFLGEGNGGQAATQVVKMHGSINWAYCDSCQETHLYKLAGLRDAYNEDSLGFPVISICKGCGGQRRPMVVPPMSFKFVQFPPLLRLWHQAQIMLNEASLIVPIGYSFSEADTYIAKMTMKAMVDGPRKKLIIVDKDPRVSAALSRQLSAVIDDFDTARVLRSRESCETVVPKLAESLVSPVADGNGHRDAERDATALPATSPSSP